MTGKTATEEGGSRTYPLVYRVDRLEEPITAEEARAKGLGATDEIFIGSIVHTPDGGRSYVFVGLDGTTGESMPPVKMFRLWAILASRLIEELPPGEWRGLCEDVHASVCVMLKEVSRDR